MGNSKVFRVDHRPVFVIVGAGLAGARAAEALRDEGFDGRVLLVGEERERPYNRPPLSKDFLQDNSERDKLYLHSPGFYVERDIELRLGDRVTMLDPATHSLGIAGSKLVYERLLLATGSTPRRLHLPGADLTGVHYLRTMADCEALKVAFDRARTVAIIGAGWIGLESAAAARSAGLAVTVLERAHLPLLGALGPELARVYADLHTRQGVDLLFDVEVSEVLGEGGNVTGVRLSDGSRIDADMVVVGVGASPNVQLAQGTGIDVDDGVVVDRHLVSSDPDVFAAGDVASVPYPGAGPRQRLEHWSAAFTQGPIAAANMAGRAVDFDEIPYFFSDQYYMGMEYRGGARVGGYDRVVIRGDMQSGKYIAFWIAHRQVLAAMNVNIWDQGDALTDLIRAEQVIDPSRLTDPAIELADLARPSATRVRTEVSCAWPPVRGASSQEPVIVAVARPLADSLVVRIRRVDRRIEVTTEHDLLPRAEVLFGVPDESAEGLRAIVHGNTNLRWIQGTTCSTSQQVADARLTDAERARVLITSADGVYAGPLAEFAMFGILTIAEGLPRLIAGADNGRWVDRPITELAGRTLLVVGLGPVGREVARMAKAFGMMTLGINRTGRGEVPDVDMLRPPRFLGDLLPRAHVTVLAVPDTEQTHDMIDRAAFGRMRHGGVVVNLGSRRVVDEAALVRALSNGSLAGAALDTSADGAPPSDSPLWLLPNALTGPHAAALSDRGEERLVALFVENLRRYLLGEDLLSQVKR